MVEVEHHPQPWPVYGLDERERVLRTGERCAGVVDHGVQVLQAERHACSLAQLGQPAQRPVGVEPHCTGDLVGRAQWHAVRAELGAEHQETAAVEPLGDSEGLFCALKEGVSAVLVKKAPAV